MIQDAIMEGTSLETSSQSCEGCMLTRNDTSGQIVCLVCRRVEDSWCSGAGICGGTPRANFVNMSRY
jgi:hypothetical protein